MITRGASLEPSVLEAYASCQCITRHAAKTFYWGSLLLPLQKRQAAWALYAFCRSVDDIADHADDPIQAKCELAQWRAWLRGVYQGEATHPIMIAWREMLSHYAVPLQPALDLIDGVEMDLDHVHPATFDELRLYCYRVAGTVGLLMCPVLGYRSEVALPHAVELGIAMQLTNILRDVGEDARNGRIYLPQEDLERFGYSEADLLAGTVNAAFIALMQFEMARAQAYYERARPGIELLDRGAQFAILTSAELYRAILPAIVANDYDVYTRRAAISLPAKLLLMPRIWLASKGSTLTVAGQHVITAAREPDQSPV